MNPPKLFAWSLLLWFFFSATAFGRFDNCKLETLVDRPTATPDETALIQEGAKVFKVIDDMMADGVAALPAGGKALSIPSAHRQAIIRRFVAAYLDGAKNNPKDFIAGGNVGHMRDHLELFVRHKKYLAQQGFDEMSFLLAVVAHDTGKALLDSAINSYLVDKTNAQIPRTAFLMQRVLSHEYHSIANVPKIVTESLKRMGLDPDTPEGKALVVKYSGEIIEAIRLHNGVGIAGNLKSQYPSLNETELEQVRKAWWASFNKAFAETTGSRLAQYGESEDAPVTPIGQVLNLFDRITLTTAKAPWKLGTQNAGSMPFGTFWLKSTFVDSAIDNDVLVLAQGEKVVRGFSGKSESEWAALPFSERRKLIEGNPLVVDGLALNTNLRALGQKIIIMNQKEVLQRKFAVPENEMPISAAMKLKEEAGPAAQYLYWIAPAESGTNYRVIAKEGSSPRLEKWTGQRWQETPATPGLNERTRKPGDFIENDFRTPTHLLMAVVRSAGAWKGTPP